VRSTDLTNFLDRKLPALQGQYGTELQAFLKGVNDYDPEPFQKKLKGLSALIAK